MRDQALDRGRGFFGREARPQALADGSGLGVVAADRDLVVLDALLVQAEDADVADVVVAAGIDAA